MNTESSSGMGTWLPSGASENGLPHGGYLSALPSSAELAGVQICLLSPGLLNGFLRCFEPLNLHKHITIFSEKLLTLLLIT